jgi:hypothetical protein
MSDTIIVHGQRYLTVRAVADCYEVEESWVIRVYEAGLLEECERVDEQLAISLAMLDRLAAIRRLNRNLGLDFEAIAVWLDSRAR